MEIEQNTISRDWTVTHDGRRFFVNFTDGDTQTLGLCNRDNWKIREETEDDIEESDACVRSDCGPEQLPKGNAEMINRLIGFCLGHWEQEVTREMTENMEMRRGRLEGQR